MLFSHREQEINFRSIQFARQETRKSFARDYGDSSEKKSKVSSKMYEPRPEMPEYITCSHSHDFQIKKRPQSTHSSKRNRQYQTPGRQMKEREPSRRESTAASRPLVGTIKSNLFVPYSHTHRSRF